MSGKGKTIIILLLLCVIIAIVPLTLGLDSEFGGTDDEATEIIEVFSPEYEPWIDPLYEPPGGETESLLFCLQAALGAAVLGYGFGTLRERSKRQKTTAENAA